MSAYSKPRDYTDFHKPFFKKESVTKETGFFLNNANSNRDRSTNIWNSKEEIAHICYEETYTSYLGNFWDGYTGTDRDGDGIGDTPYNIDKDSDDYPLMAPCENYVA